MAKCSPEDTFDVEIGAKISYRRARRQMLVAIRNEVRAEIKKGEEYAKIHQDIYNDLTKSIEELKIISKLYLTEKLEKEYKM